MNLKENSEYVEVYTINELGQKVNTGMTTKRGTKLDAGLFVVGVNNWIINSDGKVLVQKRSRYKKNNPSKWSSTNGLREPNEESIDTVIRETKEELGIDIKREDISYIDSKIAGDNLVVDIFVSRVNVNIEDLKIQEEEVEEIRLVSREELLNLDISTTCQYIKDMSELIFTETNNK